MTVNSHQLSSSFDWSLSPETSSDKMMMRVDEELLSFDRLNSHLLSCTLNNFELVQILMRDIAGLAGNIQSTLINSHDNSCSPLTGASESTKLSCKLSFINSRKL